MTRLLPLQSLFVHARFRSAFTLLVCVVALSLPRNVRANVYATNVRVNGGTTNATIAYGGGATISYRLNEPASAGVAIAIKSGSTTVRSITKPGGGAGALRGANSVAVNGRE